MLYNQVEQMIVNDAAWIPLWFEGEGHVLVKPHIQGYVITPMTISKMRYVDIKN